MSDDNYWFGYNMARFAYSDEGTVATLRQQVAHLQNELTRTNRRLAEAENEVMRLTAVNRANMRTGKLVMRELRLFDPYNPLFDDEKRNEQARKFVAEEFEKLLAERQK